MLSFGISIWQQNKNLKKKWKISGTMVCLHNFITLLLGTADIGDWELEMFSHWTGYTNTKFRLCIVLYYYCYYYWTRSLRVHRRWSFHSWSLNHFSIHCFQFTTISSSALCFAIKLSNDLCAVLFFFSLLFSSFCCFSALARERTTKIWTKLPQPKYRNSSLFIWHFCWCCCCCYCFWFGYAIEASINRTYRESLTEQWA